MRNLQIKFGTTKDKSILEISQNFVAFSEYMNFNLNDAGKKFKDKTEIKDYFLTAILKVR